MAAIAEAQARLTSSLRDIVNFFSNDVNLPEASTNVLNDYIERHLSSEFLLLAESYGHSMAFNPKENCVIISCGRVESTLNDDFLNDLFILDLGNL